MEPQKTQNNQSNLEKEEQSQRYHNSRFQDIAQSCSNQNSMAVANRSIEQNRVQKQTYTYMVN